MWPGCSGGFSSTYIAVTLTLTPAPAPAPGSRFPALGYEVKINMHAVAFIRHGKGALRIRIAYTSAISTDAPPLRRLSHICMQ